MQHGLRDAAALLELHKHQGTPWDPAADGFVFSKEQVERWSHLQIRRNEARPIAWARFELNPKMREMAGDRAYVSSAQRI